MTTPTLAHPVRHSIKFAFTTQELIFCIRAAYGSRLLTFLQTPRRNCILYEATNAQDALISALQHGRCDFSRGTLILCLSHSFNQRRQRTSEAECNIQILFNGHPELRSEYKFLSTIRKARLFYSFFLLAIPIYYFNLLFADCHQNISELLNPFPPSFLVLVFVERLYFRFLQPPT